MIDCHLAWACLNPRDVASKNAPFAFQYDEPGKPFAVLVQETGCSLGPGAIQCLQRVPFEVSYFWDRPVYSTKLIYA